MIRDLTHSLCIVFRVIFFAIKSGGDDQMKGKGFKQIGFLDWWILIPLSIVMYLIFHLFAYFFLHVLNHKLTARSKGVIQFVGYTVVIVLMLLSLLSFF